MGEERERGEKRGSREDNKKIYREVWNKKIKTRMMMMMVVVRRRRKRRSDSIINGIGDSQGVSL